MSRLRRLALLLALVLCTPAAVGAQWPAGRGGYWAKVSVFRHQTTEQYRADGQRRPFLSSNAVSTSVAVFADVLVGVADRVDVWVQAPYFDLRFDDDGEDRRSTGVGDVRTAVRVNLLRLRGGSLPISVRLAAKAPIADLTVDAEVIPVGEGQWDYEAWLEGGISLWPLPAYSVVWVGYRWRTLNEVTTRRPGDEVVFLAEVGATRLLGGVGGKVIVDGLLGRAGSVQGIRLGDDDGRRILYVAPTATWAITSSTLVEVAARIPLLGRNFPAGVPLQIGLFHQGSLFD